MAERRLILAACPKKRPRVSPFSLIRDGLNCGRVKVACVFAIGALWIPPAYAQQSRIVQVDDSFNGRQIQLHVGETLAITLSENASTGFQWIPAPESARKSEKVLHEKQTSAEGAGGIPGKPGARHFYFEAIEPGTVEMELHYRRPWETGKPPARKFKLRIHVRPALER
ncbi:MAG: protease inhibitor I42 family protein [Bryobacteraceae bacterium]